MYEYDYGYTTGGMESSLDILGLFAAISGIVTIVSLIVSIILLVSQWKVYKKAGKKGWECLVPVYNIIVLLEIVELPMWYIVLFLIPFANIFAMFKIYIELAHKFGKSTGFGVMTIFFSPICFPILAFSKKCVYQGNINNQNNTQNLNNMTNSQPINSTPNNNINNNENQLNNNQQPIMFNQNINTEVNPINSLGFQPIPTENNSVPNNMTNQPINLQSNPNNEVGNQQPNLNVIPAMSNQTSQETQNIVNIPQMNMNQPEPVVSQIEPTINQPITFNQEPQANNSIQGINVIPNLTNNAPQINNTNTDVQQQQSNHQPEVNVIPNIINQPVELPKPIEPQNIVNIPQMNMNQPEPVVNQSAPTINQPITFNQEQQMNNPMPGINVIPTLGPTPTMQNTDSNQNM